ncbi:hypothetical protein LCGC14_2267100 [marine sediment metagenome]|uniref:Uncharacterized protein n=1 Tax=marine sediment metagenome TaxID=412755 RepID=A0A0F9CYB4_9ZZZZ
MTPQIIYIVLFFIGFGLNCHGHGKPVKYPTTDVWTWLVARGCFAALLWWGGWFDCFVS